MFTENKEQNATNSNIATSNYVEKVLTKTYSDGQVKLKLSKISDKIINIEGIEYYKYKAELLKTPFDDGISIYLKNIIALTGPVNDWKKGKYIIIPTDIDINDIEIS